MDIDIREYLSKIGNSSTREAIVEAFTKDKVLSDAMSTVQGKMLFNGVVDRMTQKIGLITEMCLSSTVEPKDIKKAAREVYECKLILKDWANIFNNPNIPK